MATSKTQMPTPADAPKTPPKPLSEKEQREAFADKAETILATLERCAKQAQKALNHKRARPSENQAQKFRELVLARCKSIQASLEASSTSGVTLIPRD